MFFVQYTQQPLSQRQSFLWVFYRHINIHTVGEIRQFIMYKQPFIAYFVTFCVSLFLIACDNAPKNEQKTEIDPQSPHIPLQIQPQRADYATPFCEHRDCLEIQIESIKTQNSKINQWIERSQSRAIQQLIGLNHNMDLQQAVNAYIKKSDEWQKQAKANKSFRLNMSTRLASQRQHYVLLHLMVYSEQGETTYKNQSYFFVYDRLKNKRVSILDTLKNNHQHRLDAIIQEKYQTWLAEQSEEFQANAPSKLYWGQADWFFDQDGVGLHYRQGQITEKSSVFNIYLTAEQTEKMLDESIYRILFPKNQ